MRPQGPRLRPSALRRDWNVCLSVRDPDLYGSRDQDDETEPTSLHNCPSRQQISNSVQWRNKLLTLIQSTKGLTFFVLHRSRRSLSSFVSDVAALLLSNRQHLSCGDCLEGKRGDYLTSSVLLCIIIVYIICTPIQFVHGRLDRALILLGLAVFRAPLCLRCTWRYM